MLCQYFEISLSCISSDFKVFDDRQWWLLHPLLYGWVQWKFQFFASKSSSWRDYFLLFKNGNHFDVLIPKWHWLVIILAKGIISIQRAMDWEFGNFVKLFYEGEQLLDYFNNMTQPISEFPSIEELRKKNPFIPNQHWQRVWIWLFNCYLFFYWLHEKSNPLHNYSFKKKQFQEKTIKLVCKFTNEILTQKTNTKKLIKNSSNSNQIKLDFMKKNTNIL